MSANTKEPSLCDNAKTLRRLRDKYSPIYLEVSYLLPTFAVEIYNYDYDNDAIKRWDATQHSYRF